MGVPAAAGLLFRKTHLARLFFGSLLLLIIVFTRWFWIDCDGGTPSLMEYGYFATDEGYYASGGKNKLIYGRFINALRAAPCTYAISPSSHLLTWFAFLCTGQNTWAHRLFPFLINTCAWLVLYRFLSRRTPPWLAFLICGICLLNPFTMVYGRTACNDTLMASLLLFGYVLTRKRGLLFAFLGGFVFGLGLWIKQSIWALFPFGASAAAMAPSGRRLPRVGAFLAGFVGSAAIQYGLIRLLIWSDAASQDISIERLLDLSDSSYPLPNPFDWSATFRGISSFPRCPADGLLGVWIALFLVLPCLLLLRRLTDKPFRWDGRMLLYLAFPLYAAGIIILPVFYAHYYIPLLAFVPVLWVEARRDLKRWRGGSLWLTAVLLVSAVAFVLASYHTFVVYPDEAEGLTPYLSNAYNLPPKIVWCRNGFYILATAMVLLVSGLIARRRRLTFLVVLGVALSALGVADLCFYSIPLCEAYKHTPIFSASMKAVAGVLQVSCVLLFFAVWGPSSTFCRGVRWHVLLPLIFVGATLANPVWRSGSVELTTRGTLHRQAVAELAKVVPDNAVVFGERAPQLFLSLKARVSPAPNRDPVPTVLAVHERFPDRPLFALLDSEHNYHFTHYEENKDRIRLEVLRTLRLPSFNTGLPSDVFLVRLHVSDPPVRQGPLRQQ